MVCWRIFTYNMLVEAWGLSPRLREHAYRVPRPFLPYMGYLGSLGATPETWEISLWEIPIISYVRNIIYF